MFPSAKRSAASAFMFSVLRNSAPKRETHFNNELHSLILYETRNLQLKVSQIYCKLSSFINIFLTLSASCLYVYKRQPRTMVSDGNCYLTLLNKLTGNCAATQAGMETLTVNELHRNARDVTVVLKGESSCVHQQDMKVISLTQVHNCFQYLTGSAPIPHVIQSIPYNIDFLR